MSNEIVQHEDSRQVSDILTIQQLTDRVSLVKKALDAVMVKNEHYGIIPGCGKKPTLLKAGTEKLCMLFRLSPTFDIRVRELEQGHREYEILTTLRHIRTGEVWAQGVGCCSTSESKYKNRNPVDMYNTVLKMAKKRSQADAVLTATGASDIFTQDIEDMVENGTITPKPIAREPVKFDELQPKHQDIYIKFINEFDSCETLQDIESNYNLAKNTFSTSITLTKECIDKTLSSLKEVYETKIEEFKTKEEK